MMTNRLPGGGLDHEMERPGPEERPLDVLDPLVDLSGLAAQNTPLGVLRQIMAEEQLGLGDSVAGVGEVDEDGRLGIPGDRPAPSRRPSPRRCSGPPSVADP
jgi:hypothetical protein